MVDRVADSTQKVKRIGQLTRSQRSRDSTNRSAKIIGRATPWFSIFAETEVTVSDRNSSRLLSVGALEKMNFDLAFKRVVDELAQQRKTGRAFVANPGERELVELDLASWLSDLRQQLLEGNYVPGLTQTCATPKGSGLMRPGVRMSIADRVVYTAAVGSCVRYIVSATKWSQRKIDFAPLFADEFQKRHWLLEPFTGWDLWTTETLRRLSLSKTKYVVTADIAGYFENISLSRLKSELTRTGCPAETIELIARCLLDWSAVRDSGLPQGVLASDVLAKLYMESFDKRLKDEGYAHIRYVDDIRVFCGSEIEARRALVLVTELLRERGLVVQSAKTKIRPADGDLKREFAGAVPVIKALHLEYVKEALDDVPHHVPNAMR